MKIIYIFMALAIGAISLSCTRNELHTEQEFLMGTIVEIICLDPRASKIVFDEIRRVESIFSAYKEDSLVSKLNKEGIIDYDQEIATLIKKSLEFYRLTGGRFDITIGPLSRLWKKAISEKKLPSKEEIDAARALVGADKLLLTKDKIELKAKGMMLDFGAIAKGYAVDCAIQKLKENGINSAIVNAGGDTYCLGAKFQEPWSVGIQHPRKPGEFKEVLRVTDKAVVTSGDYEQFFEIEGRRYSHIINPRTGYSVDSGVVSVTIVADSCTLADAIATSVFLLGKEAGLRRLGGMEGLEKIVILTERDLK